jgi:hypothetical protein
VGAALGGFVASVWTSSCGPGGPSPEEVARRASEYDDRLDCTDTSALFEAEIEIRSNNQYVDRSSNERERCFNCRNYEPAPDTSTCGGCSTVPGPINPLGHCTAWIYKA